MCASVIGVVRTASRLDALVYEVDAPADPQAPWRVVHRCVLRPVEARAHAELVAAWEALGAVATWGASTLAKVMTVLRDTVPGLDAPADLRTLGPVVQPLPPPKATAAHPRGYRGTKYRPPRPAQPEAVDVRPYLMTRRHAAQVLELLGQPRDLGATSIEPWFVMHFSSLLRGCSASELGDFAVLARNLELATLPELRAALVGLWLAAGEPQRARSWWAHVLAHAPEARVECAQLVIASGAATRDALEPGDVVRLAGLSAEEQWAFYRGFAIGAAPAYLWSGFDLGALPARSPEVPRGQLDVTACVEAAIAHLGDRDDSDWLRGCLWEAFGREPGLVEHVSSPAFRALSPDAADVMVQFAMIPVSDTDCARLFGVLLELAADVVASHQRQFLFHLTDVYDWATDNEASTAGALARCVELFQRVARPPFSPDPVRGSALASLGLVFDERSEAWEDRKAIVAAPDASWLALEHACLRINRAVLIGRGLNRLGDLATQLLVRAFPTRPSVLLETAEHLAAISFEEGVKVLDAYATSPLATVDAASAALDVLCSLVEPIARAGGPNPVRRALRRHLAGEVVLSAAQLRGHRERLVAELDVVRLAAIRQAVDRALATKIGGSTLESSVRHAASMLSRAEGNRRSLRKLLVAATGGDHEWALRHPRTRAWFARHPRVDRERWLQGVETRGTLDGVGEVCVAIETDPLEALKLGTYAGSCLGHGGSNAYSAAAVVLDANKRVVYARDARGEVIGRQLLALSDADELVCFDIYGSHAERLKPLFRDYDHAFAAALQLPIYDRADRDYVIAGILSHEWWDDGAWVDMITA